MISLQSFLPVKISSRASLTQAGQSESVRRGHPSVGLVFSQDFSSGFSDQVGVNDCAGRTLLTRLNTAHAPLAAMDKHFSKYFAGACISSSIDNESFNLNAKVAKFCAKVAEQYPFAFLCEFPR